MNNYIFKQKTEEWLRKIAPYNKHKMKLNPKKTVLLVVDMQNDFINKGSAVYTPMAEAILPNLKKLIVLCRRLKIPVIYTAHCHQEPKMDGGMTAEWWPELKNKKVLVAGTKGAEIYPAIAPKSNEKIIFKHRYSAFYNTELEIILRGLGVTDLIISGVMTNICCESTARDAFFRDFRVFFLADGTGSVDEELHIGSLRNLAYAFAYVTTVSEILKRINPYRLRVQDGLNRSSLS
ncbi:MAG: isochorismatase family protein [candidate division WOR-3 bacterium]